jgi:UDP-N-acetylmuramate dehydrogenase
MSAPTGLADALRSRMPDVRGSIEANAPLAPLSWFRTGGPAEVLFTPADEADLATFMHALPADVPWIVIGLGSNLLVRDGGVDGVVIRLGKGFSDIVVDGLSVTAGAAAPDVKVARVAAEAGIAGFAFLRGIPGAIGGALRMNGGAYGGETKDIFASARAVSRSGEIATLGPDEMGFAYRTCRAAPDLIFTSARFVGQPGDPATILAEMQRITDARSATQPVNTRTGGSTFKNPPGHSAWKLVDEAGCRGLTIGGAQVSPLHTNFLVNLGDATAADIEGLGEEVRRRVKASSGIDLEWEIKRIGRA